MDNRSQISKHIVKRSEHAISRENISQSALKVLYGLKKGGYQSYLVGGGVRDLLLGVSPKDFDIVTNAHPEQVAKLFRRCRLIGRRFRLAHVYIGKEIIEVATFRGGYQGETKGLRETFHGVIVKDNIYGNIDEDVWRRDFTVNALYYNISDFSVLDFTGGLSDIASRTLRLIGEPELRYQEDPVRILRAIRFAAKLQFEIEASSAQAIPYFAPYLKHISSARLFEESIKLFHSGYALNVFELLLKHDLFEILFPESRFWLKRTDYEQFIRLALVDTDWRVQQKQSTNLAFLYAVLLWPSVLTSLDKLEQHKLKQAKYAKKRGKYYAILSQIMADVFDKQKQILAIPRRFIPVIEQIWLLQSRFVEKRSTAKVLRFLNHPKFRAAFDFFLLRAKVETIDPDLVQWWAQLQNLPDKERRKWLTEQSKK